MGAVLRVAISRGGAGTWRADGAARHGRWLAANVSLCAAKQLGWSDEQRARLATRDRGVMDDGAPLLDQRETLRDASGQDIDCLASRVPLRDQAGNLIGMLGVFVAIPDAR